MDKQPDYCAILRGKEIQHEELRNMQPEEFVWWLPDLDVETTPDHPPCGLVVRLMLQLLSMSHGSYKVYRTKEDADYSHREAIEAWTAGQLGKINRVRSGAGMVRLPVITWKHHAQVENIEG